MVGNLARQVVEPRYVLDRVDMTGPCWVWTNYKTKNGYGRCNVKTDGKWKVRGAHCVAYEAFVGNIPDGMCVLHKCDNPSCCNPSHLSLGTHQQNMSDMMRKGRGRGARGERNKNAKLTESDVDEIRASSHGSTALANKHGVSRHQIWLIRSGRSWKRSELGG